jgi:hypothetical protein
MKNIIAPSGSGLVENIQMDRMISGVTSFDRCMQYLVILSYLKNMVVFFDLYMYVQLWKQNFG